MRVFIGLIIICFSLSACTWRGQSSKPAVEKKPHELHHTEDSKGRDHFPKYSDDITQKTFIFDPSARAWAAYDADGDLIKTGRASGGKAFCADINSACRTVTGKFRVHTKRGPDCVSTKFPIGEGGAPMPHCMFFHGGYAVHGSYHVPDYNASHGCIRVLPSAAQWLDNDFMSIGTKVVVRSY